MKKPAIFSGIQRDKLIVALQMHDITFKLNLAMRVRKVTFTIDYAQDHFPRLYMQSMNSPKQVVMQLDQRKHRCFITPPTDRDLFYAFYDITERLEKLGGRLSLTGDKPKQGPMRCLLQVYVDGATRIALTLMETTKGKIKSDTSFQLPDGTTP